MDDVVIRRAGSRDVKALASLIRNFRDHLAASAPTDAELEHYLPGSLGDPGIEFSCAWLYEDAVGYTRRPVG